MSALTTLILLAMRSGLGSSSSVTVVCINGHGRLRSWSQAGVKLVYEEVLPYFKRAENFNGDGDLEYHGTEGRYR